MPSPGGFLSSVIAAIMARFRGSCHAVDQLSNVTFLTAQSILDVSTQALTIVPTGNALTTLSSLSAQGKTISSLAREYLVAFGLTSDKGAPFIGANNNGDKVALYVGAVGEAGTGNLWAFNPLLTLSAGSGPTYAAQVVEVDINNFDGDRPVGGPGAIGVSLDAGGSYLSTAAVSIGGTQPGGWHVGVITNEGVSDVAFFDGSNATVSFEIGGAHTYAIVDNSASAISLSVNGVHVEGINLLGGTFSGDAILSPGVTIEARAAPSVPPAGRFRIYMDRADNKLKAIGPNGTVTVMAAP